VSTDPGRHLAASPRWWVFALITLLCPVGEVRAENILRRSAGPGSALAVPGSPDAALRGVGAPEQQNPGLRRARDVIRAYQAAQAAARTAAQGLSAVSDGLGAGGLQVDPAGLQTNAADPVQTTSQDGRIDVTIVQTGPRAVRSWTTFNVGPKTDVNFDQTAGGANVSDWVILNRVTGVAPSQILGSITAKGQVYVLNRNNILFSGTSQVNVGTLVLAGLDVDNQTFLSSALSSLAFSAGNGPAGRITIAPGASIQVSPFGRVVLVGGALENGGSIEAPDGQVFLAAGNQVTLAPATDLTRVRGLRPPETPDPPLSGVDQPYSPVADGSGTVLNTGLISAPRGNITMVAGTTRQEGVLTSTTGAQSNGSIVLGGPGFSTELGPGSVTQILPDSAPGAKKVIGTGSDFVPSLVRVLGDRIDVLEGATVYAPAGNVELRSKMMGAPKPVDPSHPTPLELDDTSIYIESGARLDVSGLLDVSVAMEDNSIKAELRANELRDNPVLRNGPLRSRTVYFDLRQGGSLEAGTGAANLGGYYDLIERDVSQLMTQGGSVSLYANQVVAREGSLIDLSGGSLSYQAGYVRRTALLDAAGRRVPIESAVAGTVYLGIDSDYVRNHPRWGQTETFAAPLGRSDRLFENGYVQGGSAGSLTVGTLATKWYTDYRNALTDGRPDPNPSATTTVLILDGELAATTIAGQGQRNLNTGSTDPATSWSERPAGASLSLTNAGDVTFGNVASLLPASFARGDQVDPSLRDRVVLPARWFDGKLVQKLGITSGRDSDGNPNAVPYVPDETNRATGGHLTIGAGVVLDMGDGGSFTFTGKSAQIDGTIRAPGGTARLSTLLTGDVSDPLATTLQLGPTATIDVAGRFTNDAAGGAAGPIRALKGGTVSLTSPNLTLDPGSVIDVSGGGRLDPSGTKLTAGAAGSISLNVAQYPQPLGGEGVYPSGNLSLGGNLFGYSLSTGGTLSISTGQDLEISSSADLLRPGFFGAGGFSHYAISALDLTVRGGTQLVPSVFSLVPERLAEIPTGSRLAGVLPLQNLTDLSGNGQPMNLELGAVRELQVEKGASILVSPGSRMSLASLGSLVVDGTVEAKGGALALTGGPGPASTVSVLLGPDAQLIAPGYLRTRYTGKNVTVRDVLDGGTVTISSSGDLEIDPAARIDVSGTSGPADLVASEGGRPDRYSEVWVSGDAGSVTMGAVTGTIAGRLVMGPGDAAGQGGSLSIKALGGRLVVGQSAPPAQPVSGALNVVADALDASGADDLVLQAGDPSTAGGLGSAISILFDGSVELRTRRSIALISPVVQSTVGTPTLSNVSLSASHVSLVGVGDVLGSTISDDGSGANLTVQADVIDIAKTVLLGCSAQDPSGCVGSGFAGARFLASGDIRLSDHDPAGSDLPSASIGLYPGLLSAGPLQFQADQVYVVTRGHAADTSSALERPATDPGFLIQSGVEIAVSRSGSDIPAVPLSFGERLTLRAPLIEQGGVVRAPLGQISLEAVDVDGNPTGSVILKPGSITSVAGPNAAVPFGLVQPGGVFLGYDSPGEVPSKTVKITAANIDVQKGATLDVSGGGDLVGYTQIPGNGGSYDVLAPYPGAGGAVLGAPSLGKNLAAPFAVVAGWNSAPAPVGSATSQNDGRLRVGDEVWLQGAPGLQRGYYTLLPAQYALLPGGFLVQPLGGTLADSPATWVRPDGAVVTGGKMSHLVLADPADPGGEHQRVDDPSFSQFAVMSQAVFRQYSDLVVYGFDSYARTLASDAGIPVRTPYDAGGVVLKATANLALNGSADLSAPSDGLLGNLDISAQKIAVVSSQTAGAWGGYVQLDAQSLSAFGAGSVMVGGTRGTSTSLDQPGTTVTVPPGSEVVVDLGSQAWTAPEILLAASNVTVKDGSVLQATGASATDRSALLLNGAGALVRLSTGDRVPLVRTGSSGSGGVLIVGNAQLSSAGSLALEGSKTATLDPGIQLSAPKIDLASDTFFLGDGVPSGVSGTIIGARLITELAGQSDLLIRAQQGIHLYGDLSLGSNTSSQRGITLDTALLRGEPGATATIQGSQITLRNSGGSSATNGVQGAGTLRLDAQTLVLGPGQVSLDGFGSVTGTDGSIEFLDQDGAGRLNSGLHVAGGLALTTGQVRPGTSGAAYTIQVDGSADLAHGSSGTGSVDALGARLVIQASGGVALDTAVTLPGGSFEASSAAGNVTLQSNASIDVSGRAVTFQGLVRFAPGGLVRLVAQGAVELDSGAAIDVSGSAQGGDAGSIQLTSGGVANLQGSLFGFAVAGARGGSFSVTAQSLGTGTVLDLAALNNQLDQTRAGFATSFDTSRTVEVAQQDIPLGAGERMVAHEIVLRSGNGTVAIDGSLDASGSTSQPGGGRIELSGADVRVAGSLDAHAYRGDETPSAFAPSSGEVLLAAGVGSVRVSSGAQIDLSGGLNPANGQPLTGGELVVRAPRAGGDVAAVIDGTVTGERKVIVQGVETRDFQGATVLDAATVQPILSAAQSWYSANAATVLGRLALNPSLKGLETGAGVLFRSSGSLRVTQAVTLGGSLGSGFLGFTSAGDLSIEASVSDGFDDAGAIAAGQPIRGAALLGSPSSSLSFESGGNMRLAPDVMVRTGTGSISVRVDSNLELAKPDLNQGQHPPVIYTAGRKADPVAGFLGAPCEPLCTFTADGGDIDVAAGGDVTAPIALETTSAWLYRYGANEQTSWSIVFPNFQQGIGALGGGDVRVRAGGDVRQLAVSIPTTGRLATAPGVEPQPGDLVVLGGGNLEVTAGGDIAGGLFVLGLGRADVRAAGRIVGSDDALGLRTVTDPPQGSFLGKARSIGLLIGLADATATITAGSDVLVEGAFDPMRQSQIAGNLVLDPISGDVRGTAFWGYTDRTSLSVASLGGALRYENDAWASVDVSVSNPLKDLQVVMRGSSEYSLNAMFGRAPPTLRLSALESSVTMTDHFDAPGTLTLASAPQGTLEVLAGQNIYVTRNLGQDEIDPKLARGPTAPFATFRPAGTDGGDQGPIGGAGLVSTPGAVHLGDPNPVRLYAMSGSVCLAQSSSGCVPGTAGGSPVTIDLPKPLEIIAGQDIFRGQFQVQNNGPNDITSLVAGRDLYQPLLLISGPGTAVLQAGRNVQITQSDNPGTRITGGGAVYSIGNAIITANQLDGNLPSVVPTNDALSAARATDVIIVAGADGPEVADKNTRAFAAAYLDPANAKQRAIHDYLPALKDYMEQLDPANGSLSEDGLVSAFGALPLVRRQIFLDRVYFTELKETGIDYNNPDNPRFQSYNRGFAAVNLLFPQDGASPRKGDVVLSGKPVETRSNGDITILAPYGGVEVGTTVVPSWYNEGRVGGVVTRRGGDIRIMADQDIALFTSRVFTLQGGDITMWTSNGGISAGFGSKTSILQRPLAYTMTSAASVLVDAFGLSTGAGIGVLDALQNAGGRPPSRLDLIAPNGEVNAGDAGIRVVGDINIAAAVVVGVENIQVTGVSTGVPKPVVPNIGALTTASQVSQAATQAGVGPESNEAQEATRKVVAELPSIITVEVVGYETTESGSEPGADRKKKEGGSQGAGDRKGATPSKP